MFQKHPDKTLDAWLEKFRPEVVGLSVRNIDNNDMQHPAAFYRDLAPIVRRIREKSRAWVVLGGAAVGLMPGELLQETSADFAVLGPGEISFISLLVKLEQGTLAQAQGVPNVAWLAAGRIQRTPVRFPPAREQQVCEVPDFGRWLNLRHYRGAMSPIPVQTKRGCPYQCVYCTYARNEGPHYQLCAPESVVRALRPMAERGWRDFEFVDNVFNAPYDHALALCRQLSRARLGLRFQSVELSPQFLNDTLLEAMESAGFVGMGVTAESAAEPVLRGLGKSYGGRQVQQAARTVRKHAIPVFWIFMVGGPGETMETLEETLDFAREAIRPQDVAFFNVGIRIYPGTPLEKIARAQGVLAPGQTIGLEPLFYLAPGLDPEAVRQKLGRAMQQRMNFLAYGGLSHPLLPLVMRTAQGLGVQPPLWRHTPWLRRVFHGVGFKV
jgi:radical SAM superfamily enzyme YgiQ (UPF0313 family)